MHPTSSSCHSEAKPKNLTRDASATPQHDIKRHPEERKRRRISDVRSFAIAQDDTKSNCIKWYAPTKNPWFDFAHHPEHVEGSSGFTLIEVMAAAALLTLGTVAVFQANLINMNVYGRYVNRLAIQNWAEEKLWEAKEAVLSDDPSGIGETSGQVAIRAKNYQWTLATKESTSNAIGSNPLYEITLNVSWPEGSQTSRLIRNSFILKIKR